MLDNVEDFKYIVNLLTQVVLTLYYCLYSCRADLAQRRQRGIQQFRVRSVTPIEANHINKHQSS